MNTSTKIILGSVGIILLGIAGAAAAADQVCFSPEAQMLRVAAMSGSGDTSAALQAKLQALPILTKLEGQMCALRNLTPGQQATIVAQKAADAKQHAAELAAQAQSGVSDVRTVPSTELGIKEAIDPTLLGKDFIPGTNTWWGYVDGKLLSVTGSARADDPTKGTLVVMEENRVGTLKTYATPSASGPVKVISEANGVLTLQSVAGTYDVYDINTDTRKNVTTKGGTTYRFDLRLGTFQ